MLYKKMKTYAAMKVNKKNKAFIWNSRTSKQLNLEEHFLLRFFKKEEVNEHLKFTSSFIYIIIWGENL